MVTENKIQQLVIVCVLFYCVSEVITSNTPVLSAAVFVLSGPNHFKLSGEPLFESIIGTSVYSSVLPGWGGSGSPQ